jgi:hypothetical protein
MVGDVVCWWLGEIKMTLEGSLRIERVAFGAWAFAV